jgi:ferrochelatase
VAKESGVTNFVRSESLNDDPQFARALADIVSQHLNTNEVRSFASTPPLPPLRAHVRSPFVQLHSEQYTLRCPACVNPDCRNIVSPVRTYDHPQL